MNRTTIIRSCFTHRFHQLSDYAADARSIQQKVLSHLLVTAKNTKWGLQHHFADIRSYE